MRSINCNPPRPPCPSPSLSYMSLVKKPGNCETPQSMVALIPLRRVRRRGKIGPGRALTTSLGSRESSWRVTSRFTIPPMGVARSRATTSSWLFPFRSTPLTCSQAEQTAFPEHNPFGTFATPPKQVKNHTKVIFPPPNRNCTLSKCFRNVAFILLKNCNGNVAVETNDHSHSDTHRRTI